MHMTSWQKWLPVTKMGSLWCLAIALLAVGTIGLAPTFAQAQEEKKAEEKPAAAAAEEKKADVPPPTDKQELIEEEVAEQDTFDKVRYDLNTVWTMVAAFLVMFMQAGFMCVETGFTRSKNAVNICMKNALDFCFATVGFWLVGFGLMFGSVEHGMGGYFGNNGFMLKNITWDGLPLECFFFFQLVFAGTTATIVSGAVAERTNLTAYMIFSFVTCCFIYPVSGHWIWGGGWLAERGFGDFAGSTVVHSCGGWLALVGAAMVGPRAGRYLPDGTIKPVPGHNIPLAALGVFILWLGWFGFNPGSTVAAAGNDIAHIACTTNAAAAAGALLALITSKIMFGKWDAGMALNGILAGLVGITAPCNIVTIEWAFVIGAIAGVIVVLSVVFIDRVLKIDDPVGAVSVHGVCGAWGTLAVGLFSMDTGLVTTGGTEQLITQVIGILAMFAWCMVTGIILFGILKFTLGLRVSPEEEAEGLDIGEHGYEAYPGFQTL